MTELTEQRNYVVVVSGLPRSGTSMVMKMLEAGGIQSLTDQVRQADVENPNGYYEFERTKKLPEGDNTWMENAQGKSVKIISALLKHIPQNYSYRIIFMRRRLKEILASQQEMLIRRGKPTNAVSDQVLTGMYQDHLQMIEKWLGERQNIRVLYVDYNQMLEQPYESVDQINWFLDNWLNLDGMVQVVDRQLYRQRK